MTAKEEKAKKLSLQLINQKIPENENAMSKSKQD